MICVGTADKNMQKSGIVDENIFRILNENILIIVFSLINLLCIAFALRTVKRNFKIPVCLLSNLN